MWGLNGYFLGTLRQGQPIWNPYYCWKLTSRPDSPEFHLAQSVDRIDQIVFIFGPYYSLYSVNIMPNHPAYYPNSPD